MKVAQAQPNTTVTRNINDWKKVYYFKCLTMKDINDSIPSMVSSWRNIKTPEDLVTFFKVHPHHGMMSIQQQRPILFHSILVDDDKPTFIGSGGVTMKNDPWEIVITSDMLRRSQPGKTVDAQSKDKKPDTDDASAQSKGSKNEPGQPTMARINHIFLVPPIHVHQLLCAPKGTFTTIETFEQWIVNKQLLSTGPVPPELESNGTITGYNAYWGHLQNWLHGLALTTPNHRCHVQCKRLHPEFPMEAYFLTHIPQELWIYQPSETTQDPEPEDTVVVEKDADILGQAVTNLGVKMGQPKPKETTKSKEPESIDEDSNQKIPPSDDESEASDIEYENDDQGDEDSEEEPEPTPNKRQKSKAKPAFKKKQKGNPTMDMFAQLMQVQVQLMEQLKSSNENMARTTSETLAHLTSIRVANESTEPTTSKESTTLWAKLLDTQQLALTRGAAPSPGLEPDEPVEFTAELYAHKNKTLAKTFLENKMADLHSKYHPAVMANLVWNGPLWSTPTEPERLTIFAFHPMEEQFTANKKTSMMASLQTEFEIKVDKEDIQQLYHQDLYFPIDTYNFLHMLESYAGLLEILFGPDSYVANHIREFSNRSKLRFSEFSDLATKQGHQALSKVLYSLDVAVQTFLRKLGDPKRSFHRTAWTHFSISMTNLETNLEGQTYLNIYLPTTFTSLLKDFLNKHGLSDNKQGKQKKGQKDSDKDTSNNCTNPDPNPTWLLPNGVVYGAAFYHESTKNKCPRINRKAICLKYWVKGKCKTTCQLSHEDPRKAGAETEKAFNDYIKQAFEVGKQTTVTPPTNKHPST